MVKLTTGEKRVLDALRKGKKAFKRSLLKSSEISNLTRTRSKKALGTSRVNNILGKLIGRGKVVVRTSYTLGGTIKSKGKRKRYKGRGYRIK